jgi:formylglycine-generating enzyme required for sulfatase activity
LVNGQVGGGTTPEDPEEIVDITTVTEIVQKEEGEKAKNSNYANKTGGNGTLKNTGETGDKICNIFDMAANLLEWTTEYSTNTNSSRAYPCIVRGGGYDYNILYTANRNYDDAIDNGSIIGFRVSLYIK